MEPRTDHVTQSFWIQHTFHNKSPEETTDKRKPYLNCSKSGKKEKLRAFLLKSVFLGGFFGFLFWFFGGFFFVFWWFFVLFWFLFWFFWYTPTQSILMTPTMVIDKLGPRVPSSAERMTTHEIQTWSLRLQVLKSREID